MPKRTDLHKILVIGAGPIVIGQGCEFDYSGSQAIKALKEEGYTVVLVNSNPATIMTDPHMADATYVEPIEPATLAAVIARERPDAILPTLGGQTALNCGVSLYKDKIFEKYGVTVLGTPVQAIIDTEDREIFVQKLNEIDVKTIKSEAVENAADARRAARELGYPVIVRAAYALGGLGSGFCDNEEELNVLVEKAFSFSPQVLVEKSLKGWKEVEYEVVRDRFDNCITVCNMENFDPLGIHTGDSIVVAPSQTLTNREYMMLRDTAIKVVRHLGVIGECNIQYALNPESEEYCIIEVNARLSRSSALASKATGYPLAYVAAKLALGNNLIQISNRVTGTTTACFEPSLDYCVVKVPRWDLKKFHRVSPLLGSCMKSVGEVMSIGRRFEEALQKAVRMVNPLVQGFDLPAVEWSEAEVLSLLKHPDDRRIHAIALAMERGMSVADIHAVTKIDKWFLSKLDHIHRARAWLKGRALAELGKERMKVLKCLGFSDLQIANALAFSTEQAGLSKREKESLVRAQRKAEGVVPVVKQVDTLAAEFPAMTNYLYVTYSGCEHDVAFDDHGVMVLGCGPYAIGSSVEFDWAAVSCIRALKESGKKTIVVNFNPETVSTDYDESDRLYFEELSLERILDIYEAEQSEGVIISVGGQIPNNLSLPLAHNQVRIFGTAPTDIECAEDRSKFSDMCDRLGIDQPEWVPVTSVEKAYEFVERVDFPVLVRPSFVLSGAAMSVCMNEEHLRQCLGRAAMISSEYPVVVSKFVLGAKEIEFDAVADHGEIINYAISEHVEHAGVHSGDATAAALDEAVHGDGAAHPLHRARDREGAAHHGPVQHPAAGEEQRREGDRVQPARVAHLPLHQQDLRLQLHRAGHARDGGAALPPRQHRAEGPELRGLQGAHVLVHAPERRGPHYGRGDGLHGRGGVLRRERERGVPEGGAVDELPLQVLYARGPVGAQLPHLHPRGRLQPVPRGHRDPEDHEHRLLRHQGHLRASAVLRHRPRAPAPRVQVQRGQRRPGRGLHPSADRPPGYHRAQQQHRPGHHRGIQDPPHGGGLQRSAHRQHQVRAGVRARLREVHQAGPRVPEDQVHAGVL